VDLHLLKSRITAPEVLSHFGVKVNAARKIPCPWHDEKTPSCHVYDDHVFCYACQESGDVIKLWQQLSHNADFRAVVSEMAAFAGVDAGTPHSRMNVAKRRHQQRIGTPPASRDTGSERVVSSVPARHVFCAKRGVRASMSDDLAPLLLERSIDPAEVARLGWVSSSHPALSAWLDEAGVDRDSRAEWAGWRIGTTKPGVVLPLYDTEGSLVSMRWRGFGPRSKKIKALGHPSPKDRDVMVRDPESDQRPGIDTLVFVEGEPDFLSVNEILSRTPSAAVFGIVAMSGFEFSSRMIATLLQSLSGGRGAAQVARIVMMTHETERSDAHIEQLCASVSPKRIEVVDARVESHRAKGDCNDLAQAGLLGPYVFRSVWQ